MTARRDVALDVAKGIAMILVVLGHVLRGLSAADLLDGSAPAAVVADRLIYLVHLPAFVFASGLFVAAGVARGGIRGYLSPRLLTFAYGYVVWTLLQGVVRLAAGARSNLRLTWPDLLTQFVKPESQLWFLGWFAPATALVVALRPWRTPGGRAVVALSGVVSLLLWGRESPWAGLAGWALWGFLALGAGLGYARYVTWTNTVRPLWIAATGWGLLGFLVVTFGATGPTVGVDPRWQGSSGAAAAAVIGCLAACCGVAALMTTSTALARARSRAATWVMAGLARVGRHSLEVFLAHIVATAGTRIALTICSVSSIPVHIVAGTVAGVGLPLLLVNLAHRAPTVQLLFTPPRWLLRDRPRLGPLPRIDG